MASKVDPIAHEQVLAELWFNLSRRPRRALCELAHLDPAIGEVYDWKQLPVATRVSLVRAMRSLGEISIDCAVALERAQAALNRRPINAPG